jgi:CubicO group peptidase (beta-lactamase class C family)
VTILDLMRHTSGLDYPDRTKNPMIRKAYIQAGMNTEGPEEFDRRSNTPKEQVAGIAKVPLSFQPGSNWKYGLSTDLLGRVVEAVSGERLGQFLEERIFQPLRMVDSGFSVVPPKQNRIAEPLPMDPFTKTPNRLIDVTFVPNNDSAGLGGVSTAGDYMNFMSMLLNGGSLNGQRILSPMTVKLMASDQLGDRTTLPLSPGQELMGVDGYTFGLGFMVRQSDGLASVQGSQGEYLWAGTAGTMFWIDPKEQLAAVVMCQVPGPIRPHYRRLFKQMILAAVTDE